jgi:hypothetical protein
MSETIDNKKIVITNRVAVTFVVAVIMVVFGATKFYDETKYQSLVSAQNKERIEQVDRTAKEYTEQEVGGLRSDWERGNSNNRIEFDYLKSRLDKLEGK